MWGNITQIDNLIDKQQYINVIAVNLCCCAHDQMCLCVCGCVRYHNRMPSRTEVKRLSFSGFIGSMWLQSESLANALLIQLTKATFSSSKQIQTQTPFFSLGPPLTKWEKSQLRIKSFIISISSQSVCSQILIKYIIYSVIVIRWQRKYTCEFAEFTIYHLWFQT